VLATKVGIVRTRKGGRLVIDFYSDEELDRIYAIITRGVAVTGSGAAPIPVSGSETPTTEAPTTEAPTTEAPSIAAEEAR
jgi:hypothetical protein